MSDWDDNDDDTDDSDTLDLWSEDNDLDTDADEGGEAYIPKPAVPKLVGHKQIVAHLESLHASKKMPHALLFAGTKGIGKAKLAEAFARMLLAGSPQMQVSDFHPVVAQMQAGSLSDYLFISGEGRTDGDEKEKAVLIDIEQIRAIDHFLGLTRSSCPSRVIIIDGAEHMNANAANALLKNLEEPPPHTVMILISHNTAKLLPTIRSRCRLVQFTPLSHSECKEVLGGLTGGASGEDLALLTALADASPGLALQWHKLGGAQIYRQICELFAANLDDSAQIRAVLEFSDEICGNRSIIHKNFEMLMGLMLAFFARMQQHTPEAMETLESTAMQRWLSTAGQEAALECWFMIKEQLTMSQHLHLDYKSTLPTLLLRLIRGKMPLSLKAS